MAKTISFVFVVWSFSHFLQITFQDGPSEKRWDVFTQGTRQKNRSKRKNETETERRNNIDKYKMERSVQIIYWEWIKQGMKVKMIERIENG